MTHPKLLTEYDASDLVEMLQAQKVTVRAVLEACLERITTVNPSVNAIVSLRPNADLLTEADAMDAAGPCPDQPLWGLPMAIKDLEDTKGLRSTSGSPIFTDHIPDADSIMVARLRAAGVLVIGKTNVPEFGLGSHSYNPIFGVTRNPYDTSVSAGGSSGGAAVALATGMVPLADGSDMMGSLRNPAGWNNVYGFRPSAGLVAKDPLGDAWSQGLSTNGPMARSPRDMDMVLKVIGQPDPHQPSSLPAYNGMEKINPKNVTIGWIRDWSGYLPMENGVLAQCEVALDTLRNLGCEIVEYTPEIAPESLWDSWCILRSHSVALSSIALYRDPKKRAHLKDAHVWEIERGLSYSTTDIHHAGIIRSDWFREVARLKHIDVMALPSAQVFPFNADLDWPKSIAGKQMDSYHRWMEVVIPASLIGLPAVSIPAGFGAKNLPMGLQLIGKNTQDAQILGLADLYHQATQLPQNHPPRPE